jgi:hypothetical protein
MLKSVALRGFSAERTIAFGSFLEKNKTLNYNMAFESRPGLSAERTNAFGSFLEKNKTLNYNVAF